MCSGTNILMCQRILLSSLRRSNSSELSVHSCQATRRHIPEHCGLHTEYPCLVSNIATKGNKKKKGKEVGMGEKDIKKKNKGISIFITLPPYF